MDLIRTTYTTHLPQAELCMPPKDAEVLLHGTLGCDLIKIGSLHVQ